MKRVFLLRSGVIILAILCVIAGLIQLRIPPTYAFGQTPTLPYLAYGLCLAGLLLGCTSRTVVAWLVWLVAVMHRWVSAVLFSLAMSAEAIMHSLGIPHAEGWWIPMLLGVSGACAAFLAWWQRIRKS